MESSTSRLKLDGYNKWITVNGVMYNTDIIIHIDGSVTERDENLSVPYMFGFHVPLSEDELDFIHKERPEKVIIGCGFRGMLNLTPGAKELLRPYNYIEKVTTDAIQMINEENSSRFVAIMHIRC
jgi:hypothetical protein